MSYYIVYALENPCFQLTCVPGVLWDPKSSIVDAISEYINPGSISSNPFETIDERINYITKDTPHFFYYGPFDSVDELTSYFTNNHSELLI